MLIFIWFRDTRKAKIAATIFGAITIISLIIGGVFWFRDSQIRQNYQQVTATVTENFMSADRRTSWSDTQFQFDGRTYIVRHNVWWRTGREIDLLVNTSNPQQAMPASSLGVSTLLAMISSGVVGFFFLLYTANFLFNRGRDRKKLHSKRFS